MDRRQERQSYNPYLYGQSSGYPLLPNLGLQSQQQYQQRLVYANQNPSSYTLPARPSQHFNFTAYQPNFHSVRVSEPSYNFRAHQSNSPSIRVPHRDFNLTVRQPSLPPVRVSEANFSFTAHPPNLHSVRVSNNGYNNTAYQPNLSLLGVSENYRRSLNDSFIHGVKRERSSVIGEVQGSHLCSWQGNDGSSSREFHHCKKSRSEEEFPVPRLRSTVHIKSPSPAFSSPSVEINRSYGERLSPRKLSKQKKPSVLNGLQFGKPNWKKKSKQKSDDQASASSGFCQTKLDASVELDISFESNILRAKEKLMSTNGEVDSKGSRIMKGDKKNAESLGEGSLRPSSARNVKPSSTSAKDEADEPGMKIHENQGKKRVVDVGKIDLVPTCKDHHLEDKEEKMSEVLVACYKDSELKISKNVAASITDKRLEEASINEKQVLENFSENLFVPVTADVEEGEISAFEGNESDVSYLSKFTTKSDESNSLNAAFPSAKKFQRPKKKKKISGFSSLLMSRNELKDFHKGSDSSPVTTKGDAHTDNNLPETQKVSRIADSSSSTFNSTKDIQAEVILKPVVEQNAEDGTVSPLLHDSLPTRETCELLLENNAAGPLSVSLSNDHNLSQVHDNNLRSVHKTSSESEIVQKVLLTADSSSPVSNALKEGAFQENKAVRSSSVSLENNGVKGNVVAERDTEEDSVIPPFCDSLPTLEFKKLLEENNAVGSLSIFSKKFMQAHDDALQSELKQTRVYKRKLYTCPVPGCKENGHSIITRPQMSDQSYRFGKEIQKGNWQLNQGNSEHSAGFSTVDTREPNRLFSFGVQPQPRVTRQSICRQQGHEKFLSGTGVGHAAKATKRKKRREKRKNDQTDVCMEKKKWTWKRLEVVTPVSPLVGGNEPSNKRKGHISPIVSSKGVVPSEEKSLILISNSILKQDCAGDVDKDTHQSEILPAEDSSAQTLNSVKEDSCSMKLKEGDMNVEREANLGSFIPPLPDSLLTPEVCELLQENNGVGLSTILPTNCHEFMQDIDDTLQSELNQEMPNQKNVKTCPVPGSAETPKPQMLNQTFSFGKEILAVLERRHERPAGVTLVENEPDHLFSFGVQSHPTTEKCPREAGQPFCDSLDGNDDPPHVITLEKMAKENSERNGSLLDSEATVLEARISGRLDSVAPSGVQKTEALPIKADQEFRDSLDDSNGPAGIIAEKIVEESSGRNTLVIDPEASGFEVKNSGISDRLLAFGVQPKRTAETENNSISHICVTTREKLTDDKGLLCLKPEVSKTLPSYQTSQHLVSFKKPPSNHVRQNTWRRTDSPAATAPSLREKPLGVNSFSRQSPRKLTKMQSSYVRKGNSLIRKPSSVAPSSNSCSDQAVLNQTSVHEKETKPKDSTTQRSSNKSYASEPVAEELFSLSLEAQHPEAKEENRSNIVVISPAILSDRETTHVKDSSSDLAMITGANSSSANLSITVKKTPASFLAPIIFNYRRIRNKLIRDSSSSASGNSSKLVSSKSSAHVLKKATTKSSRFSLVWTLNGKESENHKGFSPLKSWEVLPYLFPWKRTAYSGNVYTRRSSMEKHPSLLTRKLQHLRQKNNPASNAAAHSIVRHSLRWSKSMEKRSKKETASVMIEHQKKKRKVGTISTVLGAKKRTGSQSKLVSGIHLLQGERVFRVGMLRYKMDPSRRTLIRIPDGEQSLAVKRQPILKRKMSIVPRRLSIDNNEYVRVGNGNKLVRDPKKLVRTLANEKIRWSLHTARQRSIRKQRYCQFFTRFGRCNKEQGKCQYIHDPTKVAICSKFLKGLCLEPNCKLTHKVIPERMPDCSYFLEGLCTNISCPYRHVNVNPKASVCEGFLKGYCRDGDECRKKHSYECPQFEASGKCPRGVSCKLQHKKTILPQKRRRVGAETLSRGRYFGGFHDQSFLPTCSIGLDMREDREADVFFREGRFTEFISLNDDDDDDDNDDDDGRLVIGSSVSKGLSMLLPSQVADDDEAACKPLAIMKR